MKNIDKSRTKGKNRQERWNLKNEMSYNQFYQSQNKVVDLEQPAEDYNINIGGSNVDNEVLEIIDESELELTLGPTSYKIRRKSKKIPTSDSGPSSSSSTGSSHINRTSTFPSQYQIRNHMISDLELSTSCQLGLLQIPDERSGYRKAIKNTIEIEDGLKQPPWFLQALSFNMI